MNCPKCFSPLQPNQKFCEVCGAKIGAAEMDVDKTVAADPYDIPEQPISQEPWQQSPWQQPEQPVPQESQQPSPWQQPGQPVPQEPQQPEQPVSQEPQQPSPWQQPEQPVSQEPRQPSPWQQPEQPVSQEPRQPSPWQQPGNQSYQQPAQYGPAQSHHDFSQQYQQYQQPSQYASSQPEYSGYGYDTMTTTQKKGFNPKILIIVIAAVLVVTGIVLGIVFGVKGCAANSHQIVSATTGVVLAEDNAINTNDSEAEKKLNDYMTSQNVSAYEQQLNSEFNGNGNAKVYAKGNAFVIEINITVPLDSTKRESVRQYMEQYYSNMGSSLSQARTECGVSNMVMVVAAVDNNHEIIYNKVIS